MTARITLLDVQRSGYCMSGARTWFEGHGFDWRDVVKNGVSEVDLLATGDFQAQRVVAMKRERENGQDQ